MAVSLWLTDQAMKKKRRLRLHFLKRSFRELEWAATVSQRLTAMCGAKGARESITVSWNPADDFS